ncbi:hypothetical protein HAX54_034686 [Datura stramonium]|uniref:Uncharacterized protein n=1 Tax=Datura stramonium TaxID=4076 RepID=A0ABS8VGM2_DATST|nr:hypothetical protein [Datura stramonium]
MINLRVQAIWMCLLIKQDGHASKGNEDGEDDEDGEGDNEDEEDDKDGEGNNEDGKGDNKDGEDENNDDDDDTDEKTTTVDDKTEEENDENVGSTPAEASSSRRDPSTTSTKIVEFAVMTGLNYHSPPRVGGAISATKGENLFNVLCARDVGKNISSDWIKLSADYEAFNAYSWG